MSENLSARERKAAMQKPEKITRRASTVKVSYLPVTSRVKPKRKPVQEMSSAERSEELDRQGRFVDMRPKIVHPWDWHQLYIEDESLWPLIAEEAIDAVIAGELERHERPLR